MGNLQSNNSNSNNTNTNINTNTNNDDINSLSSVQLIDFIASNYILTMDFQSLSKLNEKKYCDNLVLLTSKIIDNYFKPFEIIYLAQRIKNGEEVNEFEKEKIIFFNKNTIEKHSLSPIKKKKMCNSIAKFYIKIAHLFSAILLTINPIYIYKNSKGEIIKTPLSQKNNIPDNVQVEIYKLNICNDRIQSLSGENIQNGIHPNICSFNINKDTLNDEPGIPELMQLYFDSDYDNETGQFKNMSEKSKNDFEKALLLFYNTFTGNKLLTLPANIKSFNDIKLKNYHYTEECNEINPIMNQIINETDLNPNSQKLFIKYADNLKKMIYNTNKNQKSLLSIFNKIFNFSNINKEIRINPNLNENNLQQLIIETRNLIINLYITCEIDYTIGVKIYEALVEEKILETSQNQIDYLNKLSDSLREI